MSHLFNDCLTVLYVLASVYAGLKVSLDLFYGSFVSVQLSFRLVKGLLIVVDLELKLLIFFVK